MLNTFNINLNIDKTQRAIVPPLIHRVGDKTGLTIVAKIFQGIKPAMLTTYSSNLVCEFENGSTVKIAAKVSGNVATVTLTNIFVGNLGMARCYFSFYGGLTSQNFKITFIDSIQFTDADLSWGNANFEGKVAGSLKENPNILGRYLTDLTTKTKKAGGSSSTRLYQYINSDVFGDGKLLETDQEHYDSLENGFYDVMENAQTKVVTGNYIASDSGIDTTKKYQVDSSSGFYVGGTMYPVFARFKIPKNTSKLKVNNIFLSQDDFLKYESSGASIHLRSLASVNLESYLVIFNSTDNADFVRITNGSTADSIIQYKFLGDISGASLEKDINTGMFSLLIDCSKLNVIDKYGYFNLIQSFTDLSTTGDYIIGHAIYPQMNIDYGYLDLS